MVKASEIFTDAEKAKCQLILKLWKGKIVKIWDLTEAESREPERKNMIKITHIKWDGRKIGIALYKLKPGDNKVIITKEGEDGKPYVPDPFNVNKEKAIAKYGISPIQKNGMQGIWIPLNDIPDNLGN